MLLALNLLTGWEFDLVVAPLVGIVAAVCAWPTIRRAIPEEGE